MVAQDGSVQGHVLIPSYKISKSQLIAEQPRTKYAGTYQKKKKKKKKIPKNQRKRGIHNKMVIEEQL